MPSLHDVSSPSRQLPWKAIRHNLFRRLVPGLVAAGILLLVYAATIQQDVNGSSHDYVLDTGEIQVALNLWGTIHYTGYPFYTVLSASLAAAGRGLGMSPALAASATSLTWSLLALLVFYLVLARILSGNTLLAALMVLVVGLTETFWLHSVIAEVYSFSLLLVCLALLGCLHLRERWEPGKWLVTIFVCGTAVTHHRILLFLLPVVLLFAWPQPWTWFKQQPRQIFYTVFAFLFPFLAYLYLPLRAQQGALWVYGQPNRWSEFWRQFTGSEVTGGLLRLPDSYSVLVQNLHFLFDHLQQQVPWFVLLIGLGGLFWLVRKDWQMGLALLFGAGVMPVFVLLFPRAVWPPAVLMPSLLCTAIGIAFFLHSLVPKHPVWRPLGWAGSLLLSAFLLLNNLPFVYSLTHDVTGREMIDRLRPVSQTAALSGEAPTVALPWGTGFFSAAYGLYVTHELSDFTLVDNRADFAAIVDSEGGVLTPGLYLHYWPPGWWESRIGRAHYNAVTPEVVVIQRDALSAVAAPLAANFDLGNGIRIRAATVDKTAVNKVTVTIYWEAARPVERDYSVAVHWVTQFPPQGPDNIIAQADSFHPVQGWYPTTKWTPGEVVRDVYVLEAAAVPPSVPLFLAITTYYVDEQGQFINDEWLVLPQE